MTAKEWWLKIKISKKTRYFLKNSKRMGWVDGEQATFIFPAENLGGSVGGSGAGVPGRDFFHPF